MMKTLYVTEFGRNFIIPYSIENYHTLWWMSGDAFLLIAIARSLGFRNR